MKRNLLPLAVFGLGFTGGQLVTLPLGAGARVSAFDLSVFLVVCAAAIGSGKKRLIPGLWLPFLAFGAVSFISVAVAAGSVPTYVIGGGMLYILRWLLYVSLYWAAAGPTWKATLWEGVLAASGLGMGILGIIQYFLYPDLRNLYYLGWDPHFGRLFGTLLDPNFTAIILSLTSLWWLSKIEEVKTRGPAIAGTVISLGALLLTYSRSGMLAFGVGIVVWGVLRGKWKMVIGILAACIMVAFILPHTGEGRNLFRTTSSFARVESAGRAIALIAERPIFGHGFNLLRFVNTERNWIDETTVPSRAGSGIDTSILFVAATTGIFGLAVFFWLLVSLFRLGISGLGNAAAYDRAAVYVAALSMVIIHSIFTNSLFYPWVMAWMWIITGTLEQSLRRTR